jgi:hypothetical protein
MCEFARPGTLGSLASFKNVYSSVIASGRDTGASLAQIKLAGERMQALQNIAAGFVIRRDASVNEAYLPKMHGWYTSLIDRTHHLLSIL